MRRKVLIATASGILLLLLGIALSILTEAKDIPFDDVLYALFDCRETFHDQLICDVRLPYALNALLAGGLLAASGVMMQGILRNPIVEPSILSTTQGSVIFVAIASILPLLTAAGNSWTAFTGIGFSGLLMFLLAVKYAGYPDVSRILLVDSALSISFLSMTSLSVPIQNCSRGLAFWIAGGFRWADRDTVIGLGIVALACMGSFLLLSDRADLSSLGDKAAASLGTDVVGLKKKIILVMIPLCAMRVAVAGNIGFVGLFAPHILHSILLRDIRHTLPLSFLFGGVLMVFPDIATRALSAPYELPVGLFTVPLGIPVFLPLVEKECD